NERQVHSRWFARLLRGDPGLPRTSRACSHVSPNFVQMLLAQPMLTRICRKRLTLTLRGFNVRHRMHADLLYTIIHIATLSLLKMLHAPLFNAWRKGRA
ncbi:hypothetical protein, partial [Caballeronia sordidicola]